MARDVSGGYRNYPAPPIDAIEDKVSRACKLWRGFAAAAAYLFAADAVTIELLTRASLGSDRCL